MATCGQCIVGFEGSGRTDLRQGYQNRLENRPCYMVDAYLTGSDKVKTFSLLIDVYFCLWLISLIVLSYIHDSVSFQLCLHIFFVRKNVTFSNEDFLLDSGTSTRLQKKKWIRPYSSDNWGWWNYLHRDNIHHSKHLRKQNYVHWKMQNWLDVLSQNFITTQMWNQHFQTGSLVMKIL